MDVELQNLVEPVEPSRAIGLEGASNFRDLGGYQGLDGRRLHWRKLFRADHLARLSASDLQTLQQLGVKRSADFRGHEESLLQAYDWPQLQRHALVVEPTVVQRTQALLASGQALTPAHTEVLMQDTYRSFVHDYAPRFAEFFQLLLHSDAPLVFHCTAGKDRTGWAAALLLTALGVSEQDVMQDYLLTNQLYQRPSGGFSHIPDAVLDVLWRVQESYLSAATELVHADFGSMDAYLTQALGLDTQARDQLAQRYLDR